MQSRTLRAAALAAVVVVAAVPVAAQQVSIKIGVFDPQRVSEETAEGKKVQADLEALRESKQKQITAQENTINDLQQQLKQQALSLSLDKRAKLELDIQRKLLELNTAKDLATRELQLELASAEARFNEKLRTVIDRFGQDEGFAVILDQGSVAWSSAAVDLTTAVIDMFDRVYPVAGE